MSIETSESPAANLLHEGLTQDGTQILVKVDEQEEDGSLDESVEASAQQDVAKDTFNLTVHTQIDEMYTFAWLIMKVGFIASLAVFSFSLIVAFSVVLYAVIMSDFTEMGYTLQESCP